MIRPKSVRVFVAGRSGTGKSTFAWREYARKYPRVLIVDNAGEWTDPDASPAGDEYVTIYEAWSCAEAIDYIREQADTGKWRVATPLEPEELNELVSWLIPVPNLRASPVLAMGGALVLVDEVDLLAPSGTSTREIRTLYRRSRHVGLSVLSTSTRPANVSREVTAQSQHIVSFAMNEPRDYAYMREFVGESPDLHDVENAADAGLPHAYHWKDLTTGAQHFNTGG